MFIYMRKPYDRVLSKVIWTEMTGRYKKLQSDAFVNEDSSTLIFRLLSVFVLFGFRWNYTNMHICLKCMEGGLTSFTRLIVHPQARVLKESTDNSNITITNKVTERQKKFRMEPNQITRDVQEARNNT